MVYKRILFPIFNQITKVSNILISQILLKWMNKLEKKDKEFYIKKMKENVIYDLLYPENETRNKQKRKLSNVNTNDDSEEITRVQKLSLKKFFKSECEFKMVNINGKTRLLKRLLIFDSSDKIFCHEYRPHPHKSNIFYCNGCRKKNKNVRAKIDKNENLQVQDKKHVCKKLRYSLEKYFDPKIIRKPNYEILEDTNTTSGKALIIFNPNDKTQCHEFRWRNCHKLFYCSKCDATVKVGSAANGNEFIEVFKQNHECQYHPYDREKYYKFKNFVVAPNFEIQNEIIGGKQRKILVIFDQNEKTKCYIYTLKKELYYCKKCWMQRITVSAKLQQNSDGENYIVLSNKKHVCEPEKYQMNDDIILRHPNFKIMEETSNGIPKLFIFDSRDKNLCFVFSQVNANKHCNRYECCRCNNILNNKCEKNAGSNEVFFIYLCKNKNGEYFIQMKNNQKHLCKPRKYEPEKYEPKIADNYFYYRKIAYPGLIFVAIIHSTDSSLCYPFSYLKHLNNLHCLNCEKLRKFFIIPIPKIDENGKEYFVHDSEKHICKPVKISTFETPEFKRLERNEITFKEKEKCLPNKKKEVKIDESRILRLPNFELRPNLRGNPEGKLIIFDKNDKSMCYEYTPEKKNYFRCYNCKIKKHHVTIKIHFDEEKNEKFVELLENEHICDPIKDEFKDKIIKSSNFMVIDRNDEKRATRIIVFTSEAKEFYYELYYVVSQKCFECSPCRHLKKTVGVKLYKNANGEEYLLKMKNEHVCTPKKYDPKKFEPNKKIPASLFQLYKNRKGEENKRLIIFTSEKKNLIYEYYFERSSFRCSKCRSQNKFVTAKLITENVENFIELSKAEHICKPIKYDPKNYKK
uniref:Uncharacterized protein n=1 Tax=Panagrolaimus davidi TaxID=227884 RepID=A0A914P0D1_9BILA